jgi:hypothetical protein
MATVAKGGGNRRWHTNRTLADRQSINEDRWFSTRPARPGKPQSKASPHGQSARGISEQRCALHFRVFRRARVWTVRLTTGIGVEMADEVRCLQADHGNATAIDQTEQRRVAS